MREIEFAHRGPRDLSIRFHWKDFFDNSTFRRISHASGCVELPL
jgi:hypothetical protein